MHIPPDEEIEHRRARDLGVKFLRSLRARVPPAFLCDTTNFEFRRSRKLSALRKRRAGNKGDLEPQDLSLSANVNNGRGYIGRRLSVNDSTDRDIVENSRSIGAIERRDLGENGFETLRLGIGD